MAGEDGEGEAYQVRVLHLFHYLDIFQLDVEVLIHALEYAFKLYVVLELDGDLVVDQSLEEASNRGVSEPDILQPHRMGDRQDSEMYT